MGKPTICPYEQVQLVQSTACYVLQSVHACIKYLQVYCNNKCCLLIPMKHQITLQEVKRKVKREQRVWNEKKGLLTAYPCKKK